MGNTATKYAESGPAVADSNEADSFVRRHTFEFTGVDSARLILNEYPDSWRAYAAFQRMARSSTGLADGYYRQRGRLTFYHGRFLGTLESAHVETALPGFLRENLSFQGEELYVKPDEFSAFPLLGRIPNSERVIAAHFLGRNWRGPVFTVAYRCHGDTATAFRSWAQSPDSVKAWMADWSGKIDTLSWDRERHFVGLDEFRRPLTFWFFSEGTMGFTGCFDPILAAEYAQKLEKTKVFWPNP